jgi:diguanylate cyclase (GGDEF)-like protein
MLGDIEKSILIVSEAAAEQLDSVESLLDSEYQHNYTRDMEVLFNNAARDTKGMIAYYFRYNPDLHLPGVGFFYGLTTQTNDLQKLPVTDLSENRESIRWWHEPTTAQKPVWIEPYYHSNSDFLMVSYVAPVYFEGQLIGVVGMDIQLTTLLNAVKNISPYENGHAHLISQTGEELTAIRGEFQNQKSDQNVITATSELDNGMTLKVCAYYRDIQSQGLKMVVAMTLTTIGVVAVFIVITLITAQRITQPLRHLAKAAKDIGNGEEMVSLKNNDRKDEIGVLHRVLYESNERLNEYRSKIEARAYRDSLTGLRNTTSYKAWVSEFDKKIRESDVSFGIAVLDINDLKKVNDTYGHTLGNELIASASRIISDTFKRSPVFRIGGDEFLVLLQNKDLADKDMLFASFDAACAATYVDTDNAKFPVSIAKGFSEFDPATDTQFSDVFERADSEMYKNKRVMKTLTK